MHENFMDRFGKIEERQNELARHPEPVEIAAPLQKEHPKNSSLKTMGMSEDVTTVTAPV